MMWHAGGRRSFLPFCRRSRKESKISNDEVFLAWAWTKSSIERVSDLFCASSFGQEQEGRDTVLSLWWDMVVCVL